MPKYMLLSYLPAQDSPASQPFMDPEERKKAQARWEAFDQALKDAGVYVDKHALVLPNEARTVRVRGDETQITDGPFADTKEFFAGYYLIETSGIDEALKWAAQGPSSQYGPVEVRPVRDV